MAKTNFELGICNIKLGKMFEMNPWWGGRVWMGFVWNEFGGYGFCREIGLEHMGVLNYSARQLWVFTSYIALL